MSTFHIQNFGCRATQADAAAIEWQLRSSGCELARDAQTAAIVVFNTCTVTAAADLQARQAIAAAAKQNPNANIIVTGCYAQRAPEDLAGLPGVACVVGNSHRSEIAGLARGLGEGARQKSHANGDVVPLSALALGIRSAQAPSDSREAAGSLDARAKILTGDIFALDTVTLAPIAGREAGHTRPTLKIQDGCNNRCAYCVIPFVRGKSRSLPPQQIITEVQRLAAADAQEIVLSGINLGSYGRDLSPRVEFADLLRRILEETDLARLRVSSIEPMDVTRELVELAATNGRLAPHFHMPLQSGSDAVLAAMHRWYRAAHYEAHANLIHELLPNAAIGADVIAGFPGESGADHRATCDFIARLPFSYLHVFSFSARPGTGGAQLPDQIAPNEIRRRARELRFLGEKKRLAFRARQMGKRIRVLTLETDHEEAAERGWTRAISGNYLDLRVEGSWSANCWLDVEVTHSDEARAIAKPCATLPHS
ncbi:MAG TPA: tRNA (N(6)-L-threonylcarbamoyladenosine(37)-C(2))-methylthiotransferase MtaB [Candidatus Acidoferrales bacterium]|nr:tRNA (N(6)-L-threonylcarbamoyladenosine(37)-C(2))-methylthiotransferase MtaB [Candidatus Acidoferrales bacterium]